MGPAITPANQAGIRFTFNNTKRQNDKTVILWIMQRLLTLVVCMMLITVFVNHANEKVLFI